LASSAPNQAHVGRDAHQDLRNVSLSSVAGLWPISGASEAGGSCETVPTSHLASRYNSRRNTFPHPQARVAQDGSLRRGCCIIVLGVPLHSWRCFMRRISFGDCPYCGRSEEVYRSHRKTWGDLAALFFLLSPARCHGCMHRHFRPLFWPAPEFQIPSAKKPVQARANEDERKRSA
jgi:hypothetical protein